MTSFPVFPHEGMSVPDQARIEDALLRVAIGDGPGMWPQPDWIRVTQTISGGYSGSQVLRIEVGRGKEIRAQIAKIGAYAAREWAAYQEIFAKSPSALCPPIAAVTQGVLDPGSAATGENEAVVYADVEHFAAAATTSLEQLVVAARDGDPEALGRAVKVVDRLFRLAPTVLYSKYLLKEMGNRKAVNLALGPDLRLRAERITGGGSSRTRFAPDGAYRHLGAPEVLRVALALDNNQESGDPAPLPPGAAVGLSGFTLRSQGMTPGPSSFDPPPLKDRWIAEHDYVSVDIESELPENEIEALAESSSLDIYGTVEYTRSVQTWDRIKKTLPSIVVTDAGVEVDGLQMAHPFAALSQLLADPVPGLVTGIVHGDLNPRNVLVADCEPYLIDSPHARACS